MSNLSMLMEAYAGRSKELVKCEGYLREIIELINNDHRINPIRSRSVYRSAEPCRKLEEELAKFFKVKSINIYWESGTINGCTYPASSITIMNRRSTNNFTDCTFYIEVYEELVYYAGLNERELMAVILHEIGHNFYYSPILVAKELLYIILMPFSIIIRLIAKGIMILIDELDDLVKKYLPFLTNITDLWQHLCLQINSLFRTVNILSMMPRLMSNIVRSGSFDPISLFVDSIGGYGNERGADSFAAKYGYGPDQASALNKMSKEGGTIGGQIRTSMGPFGDLSNDVYIITLDLIAMLIMDVHPNNNQRASSMLKKLERDLRTGDYPPGMKKDLEAEIKRMRKVYENLNENESNVQVRKCWYNMIDSFTNGHSDLREIFDAFYTKYEF